MKHKTEREKLISERDALRLDLEVGNLTNIDRLKTAHEIDQISDKIDQIKKAE